MSNCDAFTGIRSPITNSMQQERIFFLAHIDPRNDADSSPTYIAIDSRLSCTVLILSLYHILGIVNITNVL